MTAFNRLAFVCGLFVLAGLALATSPAHALCGKMNGCGSEHDFAAAYLAARAHAPTREESILCRLRMLGLLLCTHNNGPRARETTRVLAAVLDDAGAAGDPRLRCALEHLSNKNKNLPQPRPHPQASPIEPEATDFYRRFCAKNMLHDGPKDEIRMIGPGRLLLQNCRSKRQLTN